MSLFVVAALASFYMLALILDRAAGSIYALLVLSGVLAIALRLSAFGKSFRQITKEYWLVSLAMAGPFIAVLANELAAGRFSGRSMDLPLRLALFPLVFWAIMFVPRHYMRHLQWAFVIGTFFSAIKMYVLTAGGSVRYGTDFIPLTIFAEMTMLLGFFSAYSLVWNGRNEKIAITLKLLAACAAMYAAYISQSRGTWVTIPIFVIIAVVAARDLRRRHKLFIAAIFAAGLSMVLLLGNIGAERIRVAENDIQQYYAGTNIDSSIGTRFQLWKGSWILFRENPIFGVGVDGYRPALKALAARNVISPAAADFQHSHNEVLFMMAKLGLFGLIAILAIYFVPAFYFFRALRDNDKIIRSVGSMGLALCLAMAGLGLTDVMFLWWEIFPFYATSIALFLAYIIKTKESIAGQAAS